MSTANKILKAIYTNSLTIKQLYKVIDDKSEETIRGRISELLKRQLIAKFNGKITITDKGRKYMEERVLEEDIQEEGQYIPQYNFTVIKNEQSVGIWAGTEEQAHNLAKLIYGTNYEVNNIGQN